MLILLDTANISNIKKGMEYYPISGVTTNPTIIANEKKDYIELLKNIRKTLGNNKMLHVQTLATDAQNIIEEAHLIRNILGKNTYIKIPVIAEGIKSIKILKMKDLILLPRLFLLHNKH